MTDDELLSGIEGMIEQAPSLGLCSMPFQIIRDHVEQLVTSRNQLLKYRKPKPVLPYHLYAGKCPCCGVVFLDDSTAYCGNCGQALEWGNTNGD